MNKIVKDAAIIGLSMISAAIISHFITKKIMIKKLKSKKDKTKKMYISDIINLIEKDENMNKIIKNRLMNKDSLYPREEDINDGPELDKKIYDESELDNNEEPIIFDENGKSITFDESETYEKEKVYDESELDDNGEPIIFDEDGNELGDPNDDIEDSSYDEEKEYNSEDIYVISQNDFDNDEEYEKIKLYYYQDDKVLANEDNEEVNIQETIGEDSLNHFGDMSVDPTMVYVRNINDDSDYEVQLVYGSYKHIAKDLKW